MRRFASTLIATLLLGGAALAQSDPVRVEKFPDGKPFGPYRGAVRFVVGRGVKRPVRGARIVFRLVQGDRIALEEPIAEVPANVVVDAAKLAPGPYRVVLVSVGASEGLDETLDDFGVLVGEAEKPKKAPEEIPTAPPAPPAPGAPALRFVTRYEGSRRPPVSGLLRIPVNGVSTLGASQFPTVEIWKDGKLLGRNGEIVQRPNTFFWETRNAENGEYTLRLVTLDLDSDSQSESDTLALTVKNAPKAASTRSALPRLPEGGNGGAGLPAPPNWKTGRSGGLNLPTGDLASSGSNEDNFRLIVTLSRLAGDPHPRVAGAQWALESGWGKTVSGRNNYFGIKAQPGEPGTEKSTTEFYIGGPAREIARFADYASTYDCLQARLKFLRKVRYSGYWKAKTDEEACFSLQNAGYATDPSYAARLIDILSRMTRIN